MLSNFCLFIVNVLIIGCGVLYGDIAPEFRRSIDQAVQDGLGPESEYDESGKISIVKEVLQQQFIEAANLLPEKLASRDDVREWFIASVLQMIHNTPDLSQVDVETLKRDRAIFIERCKSSFLFVENAGLTFAQAKAASDAYKGYYDSIVQGLWELLYERDVAYSFTFDGQRTNLFMYVTSGLSGVAVRDDNSSVLKRYAALAAVAEFNGACDVVYKLTEPATFSIFFIGNIYPQFVGSDRQAKGYLEAVGAELDKHGEICISGSHGDYVLMLLMGSYEYRIHLKEDFKVSELVSTEFDSLKDEVIHRVGLSSEDFRRAQAYLANTK